MRPAPFLSLAVGLALLLGGSGFAVGAVQAEDRPDANAQLDGYRLGSGDKLRVIVFDEPTLGGEFVIGSTGRVTLPLIGEIRAMGLTPTGLQDRIRGTLADGFVREPKVNVEVLAYRPFYILGEVNKPGEYPYASGLTVINAIAQAQGFTYRASVHKVMIKHAGDETESELKLTPSMQVAPGDTVRVMERWF